MNLGAPELMIILLMMLVLFGYKKLPDASRSLGRSLRIFKGEMKGMNEDGDGRKATAASVPSPAGSTAPAQAAAPGWTVEPHAQLRHGEEVA